MTDDTTLPTDNVIPLPTRPKKVQGKPDLWQTVVMYNHPQLERAEQIFADHGAISDHAPMTIFFMYEVPSQQVWACIAALKETGLTTFVMDDGPHPRKRKRRNRTKGDNK